MLDSSQSSVITSTVKNNLDLIKGAVSNSGTAKELQSNIRNNVSEQSNNVSPDNSATTNSIDKGVEKSKDNKQFSEVMSNAINQKDISKEDSQVINVESMLELNPILKEIIPEGALNLLQESLTVPLDELNTLLESIKNLPGNLSLELNGSSKELSDSSELIVNPDLLSQINSEMNIKKLADSKAVNTDFIDPRATDTKPIETKIVENKLAGELEHNSEVVKSQSNLQQVLKQQKSMQNQVLDQGEDEKVSELGNIKEKSDKFVKDSIFSEQSSIKPELKNSLTTDNFLTLLQSQASSDKGTPPLTNLSQQITSGLNTIPLAPAANQPQVDINSAAAAKTLNIETPVEHNSWSKQFNDQVVWLGSNKIQAASIKLTPIDLGPVEINIKISNDSASIQFNSHSPQVRELIEQALPKLREQLNEQGIQLADADVNDNSEQKSLDNQTANDFSDKNAKDNEFFKELNGEALNQTLISEVTHKPPEGLIDYFA